MAIRTAPSNTNQRRLSSRALQIVRAILVFIAIWFAILWDSSRTPYFESRVVDSVSFYGIPLAIIVFAVYWVTVVRRMDGHSIWYFIYSKGLNNYSGLSGLAYLIGAILFGSFLIGYCNSRILARPTYWLAKTEMEENVKLEEIYRDSKTFGRLDRIDISDSSGRKSFFYWRSKDIDRLGLLKGNCAKLSGRTWPAGIWIEKISPTGCFYLLPASAPAT